MVPGMTIIVCFLYSLGHSEMYVLEAMPVCYDINWQGSNLNTGIRTKRK